MIQTSQDASESVSTSAFSTLARLGVYLVGAMRFSREKRWRGEDTIESRSFQSIVALVVSILFLGGLRHQTTSPNLKPRHKAVSVSIHFPVECRTASMSTSGLNGTETLVAAGEYQYSPLPARNYIRLLRIHQQDGGGPVTASLTSRRLDDDIQHYTSLSYSWGRNSDGDASLSRHMIVDSRRLSVTENLYDCLVRLSSSATNDGDGLLIWIDAICINQSDVDERNSQVGQMAEIYKRAAALVIWLGRIMKGAAMSWLGIPWLQLQYGAI